MVLKHRIFNKIARIINNGKVHRFYKMVNDSRPPSEFKLVFFCGANGINYLNASLVSVHKYWETLPEIFIVSDGTPVETIREQLLKWPRNVELITWKDAADHFKNIGNYNLAEYASKDLWGKKLISILYCASRFPTLYSDTDILWFSDPAIKKPYNEPILKMSQDISHCYSDALLKEFQFTRVNERQPLNAGLIFAFGDYSNYPDWEPLCKYLAEKPDNRTEQTSFAILNGHFNPGNYFSSNEVLIKVDDGYSLRYTRKDHQDILARHYVNIKATTFWRDCIYMLLKK